MHEQDGLEVLAVMSRIAASHQRSSEGPTSRSIAPGVFFPAATIIGAFVIFAMAAPSTALEQMKAAQTFIVANLGWLYILLVACFVVFMLWVGISHYGQITLGPDDEEAEFGFGSWFAMLFAAGMGIGLVFWGVAEPLQHFAGVPNRASGVGGDAETAARDAVVQTLTHWGVHTWAIYGVVGLAVAYAIHRRGRPVSLRWALEPILGDRVGGWIGDVFDVAGVVGTVFGVATSLGLGVSQIAAGLNALEVVTDPGTFAKVVLIGLITLVAVLSVVTGVDRGIRWLSHLNLGLAALLLVFVLLAGPTLFIFREVVGAVGLYLQHVVELSLDTTANAGRAGVQWQSQWTVFYWGWWISWAPFVGVFIARISRGRTVREFVGGVLLVPSLLTLVWFAVFGGGALATQLERGVMAFRGGLIGEDGSVAEAGSLFELLSGYPLAGLVIGLAILLVVIFFITSSDSGSLVVDMLASGGRIDPPLWSRIFWAVLEGAVAAALLWVGGAQGLNALRYAAIIIALPFSVVMVGMCVATARCLRDERRRQLHLQQGRQREDVMVRVAQRLAIDGWGAAEDTDGAWNADAAEGTGSITDATDANAADDAARSTQTDTRPTPPMRSSGSHRFGAADEDSGWKTPRE